MVQMMDKSAQTERRVDKFERFHKPATQPAWVFPLRKAGIARFAERGFPTLKDEDWRFTNIAPIAELPFEPLSEPARNGLSPATISKLTFGGLDALRLVFINGFYCAELSSPLRGDRNITVKN